MNLIEALKKANGKPFRRKSWTTNVVLQEYCGGLISIENDIRESGGFLVQCKGNLLADDWYVVEPKSKIEEAIEREAKRAVALNDVNGEAACFRVSDAMRRIVNLTLDEAIAAVSPAYGLTTPYEIAQRIKALKVKE